MGESQSEDAVGQEQERRRKAKRFNERLKLASTLLNNVGVGGFIAGGLVPYLSAPSGSSNWGLMSGITVMLLLHIVGQIFLSFWKSEE